MRDELELETEKLTRSWGQHESGWLGEYLVSGVEDPRLNLQSILLRHFLIRTKIGNALDALMGQEYLFSGIATWLLEAKLAADSEGRSAVRHALRMKADNAEGLEVPPFVLAGFNRLPMLWGGLEIPNYIEAFLSTPDPHSTGDTLLNTFASIWKTVLEKQPGTDGCLSVLEPACGSANDGRFFPAFGLTRFIDYTGFDLCAKNVENARALFPEGHFKEANVFEIPAANKTFDLCIVQDLLEHLSPSGLEQAVKEICRVTRSGICIGFFQMDEISAHLVRPREEYHWNLLSMERMRSSFANEGFAAQVIHISSFLQQLVGESRTHNPNAYTFFLRRIEQAPG